MVIEAEYVPPSSHRAASVVELFGSREPFAAELSPLDALLAGKVRLSQMVRQDTTIFIRVERGVAHGAAALTRRERRVFDLLLAGRSQKQIAYEVGVSFTTVNTHVQSALRKLGLGRSEQAIVVAAALTGRAGSRILKEPSSLLGSFGPGGEMWRLRVELSQSALRDLTDAEREVALLVVDGATNAEIGAARGSSPRTVANQVAAVFRKLSAHGRLELVRRLVLRPPPSRSGEYRIFPERSDPSMTGRSPAAEGAVAVRAGYDGATSWMKEPSVG